MALTSITQQKTVQLDVYDKKILYYLSKNYRMSRKQLAKQLRISPQRLHYKLQRLTKELIEPLVLINYQAIGIKMYLLFLPKLSEETKKQLMEDPSVAFFMQTVGKCQYVLNVITKDIDGFCKRLLPEYPAEIVEVTKQIPDSYNPFLIGKEPETIKRFQNIQLDKKDLGILLQLSKTPNDTLFELGESTGMDRQTIKIRIQKMEEANIIQKFRYSMNIFKLGFLIYFLRINVIPASREKILNEIRYDHFSGIVFETNTGFVIFYMPPSHRELFAFVERIQTKDPTIEIEVMQNTEYFKISPSPVHVLEDLCGEI